MLNALLHFYLRADHSLHIDIAIMDKKAAASTSKSNSGGDSGAGSQPNAEDSAQAQQPTQEVQACTIRVPTFAPLRQVRAPVQDINDLRRQDPFHYFSDQVRRLAHLLHNQGDINQEDNPPQQQQQAGERRTRISFEVHPSLLLDMDGAGEGGGGDDEEEEQ